MPEAIDRTARADVTKAHERIDRVMQDISDTARNAALATQSIASHMSECSEHRSEQRDQMRSINRKLWAVVILLIGSAVGAMLKLGGLE